MITNLLELKDRDLKNFSVHFAIGNDNLFEPLHEYYNGRFKEWQEKNMNFPCDRPYVLSLIYYQENEWLFTGFFKVNNKYTFSSKITYETELLESCNHLIGKLIINYLKRTGKRHINLESGIHFLKLSEIFKEKLLSAPFVSFNHLTVSFDFICCIVKNESCTWKNALSKVKGICLISDTKTGRLLVDAAYGEVSMWERWREYTKNGHGGNKYKKKLISLHGQNYTSNLKFSILEVTDVFTSNDEIIKREYFWKEALLTKDFGFNVS